MTASPHTAPPAEAADAPEAPADPFPGEDALCESCGYPLKGLPPAGHCPECGSAVADSHPGRRTGPAFEHHPGPIGYFKTAAAILCHPKRTFRAMRVTGSNVVNRQYLLISAGLAAAFWLTGLVLPIRSDTIGGEWTRLLTWIMTSAYGLVGLTAVFFGVIILTYIEVLGVAWFSRRRAWRVPLRSAERVASYASVGWLPGAAVMGLLMNLTRESKLQDLWLSLGGPGPYAADAVWVFLFFIGVLSTLGFETLVWVGVRQVKFANTPTATQPLPQ